MTADQLLVLADRAERPGGLTASEADRLRRGVRELAARPAGGRSGVRAAARRAAAEMASLRRALSKLHRPVIRGGYEICAHCSGWDGRRCQGLVTPWPCPTAEIGDLDRPANSSPQKPRERP